MLDGSGLTTKDLAELLSTLAAAVLAEFGPVPTDAQSNFGKFIGIIAERDVELWELAQQVYDAFNLQSAEGVGLDNLASLDGITREPATPSSVTLTLSSAAGTTVPLGSRARVPNGPIFELVAAVIIPAGVPTDGLATSVDDGPIEAIAASITQKVDAVTDWDSVTNAADANLGQIEELDSELRARISNSLQAGGKGTDQSIRADVLDLADVVACAVLSNRTLSVDANGTPGKSFLTVVHPATVDLDDVALAIFQSQPAGIEAFGSTTRTITDDQGFAQDVSFSLATPVSIWVDATVTTTADYPDDGDDQVEAAILAIETGLSIGDDIIAQDIECAIRLAVDGIRTVVVLVDTSPAPALTEVTIELTEIGDLDSTRTTVTS